MGGKTKQTQRTKNNARPSNSGRSAELLGATVPSFVGFTAHSDLGMIPLAPGFSTFDALPDTFDSSINSEYQIVLRKLSKKDPVTKVKALQEFNTLISDADIDILKSILPFWPKFYSNLSNDYEHRVRECAQIVQSNISSKTGKLIAPYLKQLAPIWIASQFDSYAPAASVASTSFNAAFSVNKVQEVLIFCQYEIIDYISKNLTFHTASTLSNMKSVAAEDAENKYQRTVISSLKTFAWFLEQTSTKSSTDVDEKCQTLLQHQKFWSFSKHKSSNIKSAWFETLYAVLHYSPRLIEQNKAQAIQICFQNISDSDSLVSPHIWGCVLLIQTMFIDWQDVVSFQKVIRPKFISLFKNIFDGKASAIGPCFLPFLSKLNDSCMKDLKLFEFYNELFENMKKSIETSPNTNACKSDLSALTTSYFECFRFVIKKISTDSENNSTYRFVAEDYLDKFIINLLKWSLNTDHIVTKFIFRHNSALIAYWSNNSNLVFYSQLLTKFWSNLLSMITESVSVDSLGDVYVKQVVELIQNLYSATPTLHDNKVKFEEANLDKNSKYEDNIKKNSSYDQKDLKNLVVKIVRVYIEKISMDDPNKYSSQLKRLCEMFGDLEFYGKVSSNGNIMTTLSTLTKFVIESDQPSEDLIDINFRIIYLLDRKEKMEQLKILTKINNSKVQQWVLQRILSYPLCNEPEIRNLLAEKHVIEIILSVAQNVINDNSKEKFNLLHKCFFQIDSGKILINKNAVEGIIRTVMKPLIESGKEEMIDACGSFIAQIMPVICTDNNSSITLQNEIFLNLFKFTINMVENENLSEDSLWEITTCWQDALSCKDIFMTNELMLECKTIIYNRIEKSNNLTMLEINNIADMVTKLILCSTEKSNNEDDCDLTNENITEKYNQNEKTRFNLIDEKLSLLLIDSGLDKDNWEHIKNLCLYFEALQETITIDTIMHKYMKDLSNDTIRNFYRKQFFVFSIIFKLICNIKDNKKQECDDENGSIDDECTEDFIDPNENLLKVWSEKIYDFIRNSFHFAAIGESLILNSTLIADDVETIIISLSEKLKLLVQNSSEEHYDVIKQNLLENASNDVSWVRTIPYLLPSMNVKIAGVLLFEESSKFFLKRKQFDSYSNLTQIMLAYLPQRSLLISNEILEKDIKNRSTIFISLLKNHLDGDDFNQIEDKKLISECIKAIDEIGGIQYDEKEKFIYNTDISENNYSNVIAIVEFIKLLREVLNRFPTELNVKNWDCIRIGLSSWILTISKNIQNFHVPQVSIFIASVYRLFASLSEFINKEKLKSSTRSLTNIIDEWENVFSREVNLVLFKNYHTLVSLNEQEYLNYYSTLLDVISPCVKYLDFKVIYNACKTTFKLNVNDLIEFALENLSNINSVRATSSTIIKNISLDLMKIDLETLEKRNETVLRDMESSDDWHVLNRFSFFIQKYGLLIEHYIGEFSYKLTELSDLQPINKEHALTYFYLWDCIVHIFSNSPAELRSLYASWITKNKFENTLLNFVFRAMPIEILKNHDQKALHSEIFKTSISEQQFKDGTISIEKCACYMYTQLLRNLPAVVRKWWNGAHSRQKTFVDKLTSNLVSHLIWQEDLQAIHKKDKEENMQIVVHSSTREVIAMYAIDEARMELIITLAQNHPLGAIKVEMGKQIGGKASSRNIGMQLTIFLTHQNGSIFDGLLIWKKNLDKKFSGVEECYVCYTVIHQDTCQLPKLTCKTCKKKFHGPCLYKWFTTSSKSTCPLCRNVF